MFGGRLERIVRCAILEPESGRLGVTTVASVALEQLRDKVLGLGVQERAELAHDLLASLDGPSDPDADAAWDAEIERRVTATDSGAVDLLDADEVIRRARERLRPAR